MSKIISNLNIIININISININVSININISISINMSIYSCINTSAIADTAVDALGSRGGVALLFYLYPASSPLLISTYLLQFSKVHLTTPLPLFSTSLLFSLLLFSTSLHFFSSLLLFSTYLLYFSFLPLFSTSLFYFSSLLLFSTSLLYFSFSVQFTSLHLHVSFVFTSFLLFTSPHFTSLHFTIVSSSVLHFSLLDSTFFAFNLFPFFTSFHCWKVSEYCNSDGTSGFNYSRLEEESPLNCSITNQNISAICKSPDRFNNTMVDITQQNLFNINSNNTSSNNNNNNNNNSSRNSSNDGNISSPRVQSNSNNMLKGNSIYTDMMNYNAHKDIDKEALIDERERPNLSSVKITESAGLSSQDLPDRLQQSRLFGDGNSHAGKSINSSPGLISQCQSAMVTVSDLTGEMI